MYLLAFISTFLFGTFRNVAMIELSWKLQVLVQASYNSEFYFAKVTKKARVYYANYRLNTIVFLEFGHCKSSSCQEQKMVGMLGLHEALPT